MKWNLNTTFTKIIKEREASPLAFTCSKATLEILEKSVKYVQS